MKLIEGNGYAIQNQMVLNENYFLKATNLADLYKKDHEEEILWRVVQQISNEVKIQLDNGFIEQADKIKAFMFGEYKLEIDQKIRRLKFVGKGFAEEVNMDLIMDNESYIFKCLTELIYPYSM